MDLLILLILAGAIVLAIPAAGPIARAAAFGVRETSAEHEDQPSGIWVSPEGRSADTGDRRVYGDREIQTTHQAYWAGPAFGLGLGLRSGRGGQLIGNIERVSASLPLQKGDMGLLILHAKDAQAIMTGLVGQNAEPSRPAAP
ncbi:MAG: hypothetical protein AAGJ32_00510 [Pseudomonadota bacterium]